MTTLSRVMPYRIHGRRYVVCKGLMDTNRCRVRTPIRRSPLRWTAYYIFRATSARSDEQTREKLFAYSVNLSRFPRPFLSSTILWWTLSDRHQMYYVRILQKRIHVISHETEIYRSAADQLLAVRSVNPSIHYRYNVVAYDRHFWDCYRYDAHVSFTCHIVSRSFSYSRPRSPHSVKFRHCLTYPI